MEGKQTKRTASMEWTAAHDKLLCREILLMEPYKCKKGSVERGNIWTAIADNLNSVEEIEFRVKQRSVRERYDLLYSRFRTKIRQEEKESGISPPALTEVESMIEEIIEREDLESTKVKSKVDNERKAAEQVRKWAMESTSNPKKEDSTGEPKKKRVRRNGSDALEFLKDKYQTESRLKEQELQLERQRRENETHANAQVNQQQQQMFIALMQQSQNMQQALLQQQEQQNVALMAILGKLASK